MFLKRLDKSSMLKRRLANFQWNALVESLQERKILSNRITWDATKKTDKDLFPFMPIAGQVGHQLEKLICRPAAVEPGYNPFPNKSLCTAFRKPEQKGRNKKQKKRRLAYLERVDMDQFLINHGQLLTSLALHETAVTPVQLVQIMQNLSNLKGLTLYLIEVGRSAEENPIVKQMRSQVSPILVCFSGLGSDPVSCKRLCCWSCSAGIGWKGISPFAQGDFGNWSTHPLNHTEGLPLLKCLSLIDLHKEVEQENANILNFIKRFTATLEIFNLTPDIELDYYCDGAEWQEDGTIFPKLKQFSVRVEEYYDEHATVLMGNLLPKFPNLEFLEL